MMNRGWRSFFLMVRHLFLDMLNDFHWACKKNRLFYGFRDTQIKLLGILAVVLAISFIIIIGAGFSQTFFSFIPWVGGMGAGEAYRESWIFGLKVSTLLFLIIFFTFLLVINRR